MVGPKPTTVSRPGYTLLEVVLSVALAMFLLGGLYVAMWAQYDHTKAGREVIDEATVARALFRRISTDILSHLPPVDQRLPTATMGEEPIEETAEGEEGEEGEEEADLLDMAAEDPEATGAVGRFNRGVMLFSDDLMLLTNRVPRELIMGMPQPANGDEGPAMVCDLRLVRYFLVMDGDKSKGLARMEVTNIMSPEALDAAAADEPTNPTIIAPEVKALSFRYFGDQGGEIGWHDAWDGQALATGGDMLDTLLFSTEAPAQVGPPAAVEIKLKIGRLDAKEDDDVEANWTTFRHVVAIPTANGLSPSGMLP